MAFIDDYDPKHATTAGDGYLSDDELRVGQIDWNSPRYKNMPFNPYDPAQREKALEYADRIDQSIAEGRPQQMDFQSNLNPDGTIKDVYQLKDTDALKRLGDVNLNKDALAALRSRALSTEDSPWLKLQMQKQGRDEENQLNQTNTQANSNYANAFSGLASRGGISSGARERLARNSMNDATLADQGVRNAGAGNRLNLNIADDATKTDMLKALPGLEAQASNFDLAKANNMNDVDLNTQKFNTTNALSDTLQKRAFDSNQYNQQMQAWAAGKSADAQANAGKK